MATENSLISVSLPAAADLSAAQYKIVQINASGQAALANATSLAVGVLQNKPSAAGRIATVAIYGSTKVVAGGTIAAGARVTSDANGNAIAATTAGDAVIGVAEVGAASGDIFQIVLMQFPFAALA
jgi:hypothetical protein